MIKSESFTVKTGAHLTKFKIKVTTGIDDDLKDIGVEVLKSELVAIFKQLDTIDPEILLDALEIYMEDLEND